MAGVVAMASVIEDFDTQPCKKSRKDVGSPVVKTITNYFSPVPKPAEKPFSPPRSNNIMDYFSRKTPSSNEKTVSPEQSKENCQTAQLAEKDGSLQAAVKQPSQKRRRKSSKAARKLAESETVSLTGEDSSCFIVGELHDDRDSAAEVISSCGVLGSDTAALLVQLSSEACVTEGNATINVDDDCENDSTCGNNVKLKPEPNIMELSPIVPSKHKAKQVKTIVRNCRKKQQHATKQSESEEKEKDSSLCDVSMEVNVDESSQLNNSTVTISFEEFVRSQSQDQDDEDIDDAQGTDDEGKTTIEAKQMDSEQLASPKAEENVGSWEPVVQVSPRTVTIQAEVHVSPKQEAAKAVGIASIFNRRKGVTSPAEVVSSPPLGAGHQLPSPSFPLKRKSNVVLQEEDLELAVLESESMPKCSESERKQFMAAFKQPGLDGSKPKSGKSQGRQKQPEEKGLDDAAKVAEEDTAIPPSTDEVPAVSQDNKVAKKQPARKGRKKSNKDKEAVTTPADEVAAAAAAVEETMAQIGEDDDKREEPLITSTPTIPTARRSRREATVRQTPEPIEATPVRKTRKCNEAKDGPAPDLPNEKPAKEKIRKTKHGVFVAEMVCPPDAKQSPIRIKFTRVHKTVSMTKAKSGSETNTSLASKTSQDSKKRKQAKKLVEKARVIQQSKKSAVEGGTLRRSSRAEASTKKSYCEDEDSVICMEDDQTKEKSKTQKSLRSLNDVLGKNKAPTGSKVASVGQEKTARKASIFDESSHDSSHPHDDEQFRARREFLKSGLPESFRKQIAKTAATKEAYSLSCSSFQPVVHVKQPPDGCRLWSLLWPEASSLCHLKELWCQTTNSLPAVSDSLCVKTQPACRAFCELGSGWKPEVSESVRCLLMEEISTSNPPFPAQMFITRLLKRHADHQQQCSASEPEAATTVASATQSAEPVRGKRKRRDDEREMALKVAKKQRANCSEEKTSSPEPEPTKRGGRTRRTQRSRPDEGLHAVKAAPIPSEEDSVVVIDDLFVGEITVKKNVVKEDVLWTEKYQPQHSSDIVGNAASVRRLHSWLREWKLRADREERKKQKDKNEEGSNDSDWDCGEEDSKDGEDMFCNTMVITGPTGVGKTAAVYACAQELGFKVFEVNASSQRSGRLILSQLKEATQSHQVDSQGVSAHKPTYFNSYGTSSSPGTLRPGSSPRKANSPRRVVSSPRKHPQSPRGTKRGGLAPTSLASFFKMGRPPNKETPNTKRNEQPAAPQKLIKANEGVNKQKDPAIKSPPVSIPKEKNTEEQSKKTATSLILFEEVDVIFDDDSGFLAAIKTFMTTTKRPVVLTTSDPAFSTMFDGNFEEILFKTPSVMDASSFLRLVCLAEDVRTDQWDVGSLLRLNGCDLRQSLLQLQLWTRSGAGRSVTKPLMRVGKNAEAKPETEEAADISAVTDLPTLPPCDTGCAESMLGLNTQPDTDIWELLRSRSAVEEALCWELLANSRRRGVDLLYSNMEKLLPLPLKQLTASAYKPEHQSVSVPQHHPSANPKELLPAGLQPDALPSPAGLRHAAETAGCSDDASPVKMSNRMRKSKRRHCLYNKDGLHSDSDSEDSFLSLRQPQGAPQTKEEVRETILTTVRRKPLTPDERLKSLPVSQCLESIADFLDNMSYLDSSLLVQSEGRDRQSGMSPAAAVVKDGMTDESRVEVDGESRLREERALEIPTAVEALSFHKCRVSVAEAWDKAQQLEGELAKEAAAELTLPVAAHCEEYSFAQDGPCQPQLVQRRRDVMESLMFTGVVGTLGNRSAAALDYLPAVRTICRSELLKEQGKVKRRFLHYLDAIHLGLERSTLQHLAEDFP